MRTTLDAMERGSREKERRRYRQNAIDGKDSEDSSKQVVYTTAVGTNIGLGACGVDPAIISTAL